MPTTRVLSVHKRQGDWAELRFMAKATEHGSAGGLEKALPFGVADDNAEILHRVQHSSRPLR